MNRLGMLVVVSMVFLQSTRAADWPQWRGPNRNGATPDKTPLLDKWPEGGPKLLWKSEKMPGIPMCKNRAIGACGSITVANGKAYVYGHFFYKVGDTVKLTTETLKKWGWEEGVPEGLVAKVEAARSKRERRWGEALQKYAEEFVVGLDSEQAKKFGPYIQRRITHGQLSWKDLEKLAKVRDKPFKSVGEVAKAAGVSIHPHSKTKIIIDPINATAQRITDGLICYDTKTGKRLWMTEFPGQKGGYYHYGASGTPAVADGRCYATGSAGTYCVDAGTGKEIWKVKTRLTNSSPLVLGGVVYVNYPDGIKAFDAKTGKLVWHQDKLGDGHTSVAPWSAGGRQCLVVGAQSRPPQHRWYALWCLDAKSGDVLWKVQTTFHYSTPAIEGDMAVTFNKGNITGYQLALKEGKVLWRSKAKYDERGASAAVLDGYVYAVGGGYKNTGAHCYDLKTGELKWTESYKKKGFKSEAMNAVIADGKVFAIRGAKKAPAEITMFKASPEKYELQGILNTGHQKVKLNMHNSPSIVDGKMYVRLHNAVACFNIGK